MGSDETVFRFGSFELQTRERRLLSAGRSLPLGPRAFDLLVVLIERAGHLVTKDELLDLVWPKLVVEENNLHVQVSALRKLLGQAAIATVSGRGYRFALELERAPPIPSPSSPAHHLPEQVTSFVGRERELAEIGSLLGSHRLLTLLGVGGIGKSRLALQVAAGVIAVYSDGVWFAELAPLADDWLVPQAVASVLGVKEEAGRPVIEALVKFVKDRRLLLILDNCEHLAHACAELVRRLLRSSPQMKILATSRDYLHVAGETTYPVPPLGIPVAQTADVAAVLHSEAGQLFSDRAVASQSAFHVTPHNAPAIAEICRRLDGIPLALELAAARVRALSPGKIAERLGDRFRVLTGGDTTALPRQQTLHACIDWSYELLTAREKVLLRRLSVFAGGWTLEAAEAVGAGGDVAVSDVLDLLTRLVEKSVVGLEAEGERYRLLETIRQFVQERLEESGEGDQVTARHAAYFLALANDARSGLQGPDQRAWFARLDLERDNLLAVHEWCGKADERSERGLTLVHAIRQYWINRGGVELGYRVTTEALSRASAQRPSAARCRGLTAAAVLTSCMGRYAEAQGYLEECLSAAPKVGDDESVEKALRMLGEQFLLQGKLAEARRHLEEALALARLRQQEIPMIMGLNALAETYRLEGDLERAEPLYQESLGHARKAKELRTITLLLGNLASVSIARGNSKNVSGMLREALAIVEETGAKGTGGEMLQVSAGLAASLLEWERAGRLYGAAGAQFERLGLRRETVDEAFLAPLIKRVREAIGERAFAAAEAAGRALSYEEAIAETRAWLENRPRLRAAG